VAADPEALVNQALVELGVTKRIGSIFEGTELAIAALEIYGRTRDALLRSKDWPFARRSAALALLKGPPPAGGFYVGAPWTSAYPPPGWLYEYAYPADCIRLGAVVPPPGMMFDLDPVAAQPRIDNDASLNPPAKVILSNIKGAVAVYTGRITDMTTWDVGFETAMVDGLAKGLTLAAQRGLALEKEETGEMVAAETLADRRRG
jgi:hypothetical protein